MRLERQSSWRGFLLGGLPLGNSHPVLLIRFVNKVEVKIMEEKLSKIFDELQKEAYDIEYHTYDYKLANQIIRKHFEKLVGQIELLIMPKIVQVIENKKQYYCDLFDLEKRKHLDDNIQYVNKKIKEIIEVVFNDIMETILTNGK